MLCRLTVFAMLLAAILAAGADYGTDHGASWTQDSCGGSKQSPINIVPADAKDDPDLKLDLSDIPTLKKVTVATKDHAVQVNQKEDETNTLQFFNTEGKQTEYEFLQFHFHSPSEHTIDGKRYDAEVHFVHLADGGSKLLVVGVIFDTSVDEEWPGDDFLDDFDWENLGKEEVTIASKFFLNELPTKGFYHYEGSLTTPPCSETVNWFVMKSVQYIHPDDLSYMQKHFGKENYRVTLPLGSRTLYQGFANLFTLAASSLAVIGLSVL